MSQDALQLILPSIVNRLRNKRNIDKTRKNNKGGKSIGPHLNKGGKLVGPDSKPSAAHTLNSLVFQ
jgi:hypothetical protein